MSVFDCKVFDGCCVKWLSFDKVFGELFVGVVM